jgi:hypothetical protein
MAVMPAPIVAAPFLPVPPIPAPTPILTPERTESAETPERAEPNPGGFAEFSGWLNPLQDESFFEWEGDAGNIFGFDF